MTRNICSSLRASTLVDAKSCIIEKDTTFTHFASTMLHINVSKSVQRCVYLYTCYSNRIYLHNYCSSSIYYFINFTSAPFFSLFSLCTTNLVTSPHLIFCFLRCTQTHPHTNTSTQTNQHKDTQTHPHTNKPTRTSQRRDRSVLNRNDRCLWNDRCLTGTISACGSYLIGACGSCLIGVCVSCLIGACASCLIGA